jgi:hypothetical protein
MHLNDTHVPSLKKGDIVNGWLIGDMEVTKPFAPIRYKALCSACGQEGVVREDVVIHGAVIAHCQEIGLAG